MCNACGLRFYRKKKLLKKLKEKELLNHWHDEGPNLRILSSLAEEEEKNFNVNNINNIVEECASDNKEKVARVWKCDRDSINLSNVMYISENQSCNSQLYSYNQNNFLSNSLSLPLSVSKLLN